MIPAQAMQGGQIESVNTPLEAKPPTDQAKPSTLSTPSFKKRPVQMLTPGRVNLVKRKIINNSGEAKSPKTGDNAAEGDAQSKNFTPDPLPQNNSTAQGENAQVPQPAQEPQPAPELQLSQELQLAEKLDADKGNEGSIIHPFSPFTPLP